MGPLFPDLVSAGLAGKDDSSRAELFACRAFKTSSKGAASLSDCRIDCFISGRSVPFEWACSETTLCPVCVSGVAARTGIDSGEDVSSWIFSGDSFKIFSFSSDGLCDASSASSAKAAFTFDPSKRVARPFFSASSGES
jgi:hypothetical protein